MTGVLWLVDKTNLGLVTNLWLNIYLVEYSKQLGSANLVQLAKPVSMYV